MIVPALALSLSPSARAQTPASQDDRTEEVQRREPVGASQVGLRALLLGRDGTSPYAAGISAYFTIPVPETINPATVTVEVRDSRDLGYYMRPKVACSGTRPCFYSWPRTKIELLGLDSRSLWAVAALEDHPDLILPVCFCGAVELPLQTFFEFVFVPIRTINLQYSLFASDGIKIADGERSSLAAKFPFLLRFDLPAGHRSPFRLVLRHVASAGSSAETYSDAFTVYLPQPLR